MNTKPKHLDPVWLRQKYEVEGLSTYDIGKIVGRDPTRVYDKLIDFGIPTRPRGLNLSKKAGRHSQSGPDSNLGRNGQHNYMKQPNVVNPFLGKHHSEATKKILSQKASVPKPYLRGELNGMSGRTGQSNPNYKDGSAPERQCAYVSAKWKKVLRRIYARDQGICKRCNLAKHGYRAMHAHHIHPWAGNPDLRFDESNIVTLCRECHRWVHSPLNLNREFRG